MTVNLSIAIMHVPDDPLRRAMIARIMHALSPDLGQLLHLSIIRDVERKGVWPTAKLAWGDFHREATHHLVLQDDMLPCPHFLSAVTRAIEARPEHPINLFSMRSILPRCRAQGLSWSISHDGIWGGTTILPTGMIPLFLTWCRAHIPESYPHDDRRLSLYLFHQRIVIWQTAPCLLEHIGAAHSITGHSNRLRVASWYPGPDEDVREIDWTRGIENPLKETKPPQDQQIYHV